MAARPRGQQVHQPRVAGAGFEHHAGSRGAARFEVHHDPDMADQRVAFGKGARASQARLLAVGEQEDDVVPGRLAGERAREFEHDSNARAVVTDPGSPGDAVVVCAGEHGLAAAGSADARQ